MTDLEYAFKELERLIKGKKQEEIVNEKYRVMALEGSTQTRALKIKQNRRAYGKRC